MRQLLLLSLVLAVVALSGCVDPPIHTEIGAALAGSPGDGVDLEVVRITTAGGGVAYTAETDQYAFVVCDRVPDCVSVVARSGVVSGTLVEGGFVAVVGELARFALGDGSSQVAVKASEVRVVDAPASW